MTLTGLPWELFNWRMLEFYGKLSFLKAGLVGADLISTVSRTYAKEIQTEEFGMGLDGVLRERADDLFGIVNGVDYGVWDPQSDPHDRRPTTRPTTSPARPRARGRCRKSRGLPAEPRDALSSA